MAIDIPSIDELYERRLNDFATALGVSVDTLGDSYLVEAKVDSAMMYNFYLKLSQTQENIYPDLAEESVLKRYGFALLKRYPTPATQGIYTATVTGTTGAVISEATQFVSDSAPGYLFIIDADYTMPASTGTITIRSLTAGIEPLLSVGDTLTSIQPLTNINDTIVVDGVTVSPVSAESLTDYREDTLIAIRTLPQGGSPADIILWCLDESTVRTVYPYMLPNPGDLTVYVEATESNTAPGEAIGVPTQATLDAVYTAPDGVDPESGVVIYDEVLQKGRMLVNIQNIYSQPVTALEVDVDIIGLSDNTIAETIKAAYASLFYSIRPFAAGGQSITEKNDVLSIGTIQAVLIEVLSGTGITYTSVSYTVDGNSETNYTFAFGNIPVLNELTNDGVPI
jgi:uncharacterized phage protein gp47/JayE